MNSQFTFSGHPVLYIKKLLKKTGNKFCIVSVVLHNVTKQIQIKVVYQLTTAFYILN